MRHFCRDIPVILIGCKTDLRKDKECTRKLKAMNQDPITYTQVNEEDMQTVSDLKAGLLKRKFPNQNLQPQHACIKIQNKYKCTVLFTYIQ